MSFCIPKPIAEKLQRAASDGQITIERLFSMSSNERKQLFSEFTNEDIAYDINLGFEKAMASSKAKALEDWVNATFKGDIQVTAKKNALDRLNDLKDDGLLNDAGIYEDLISEKLGLVVSKEEVDQLVKLSDDIQKVAGERTELGQHTPEYFKKLRDISDYTDSITPSSQLKVLSSVIGRGNLLFRTASTILNIATNTEQGIFQGIKRRIVNTQLRGYDKELVLDYMKEARKIWKQSAFDISRVVDPSAEFRVFGEKITSSQGPGVVRKIGRFFEDVIYTKALGSPDAFFASFARADSTMTQVSAYVHQIEKLKGDAANRRIKELFVEAMRPDDELSNIASVIRDKAIFDAQVSTFTQDSFSADISLKMRKVLNDMTGDVRLGDQVMPFVKTVSNVVEKTLDATGITLPIKLVEGIKGVATGQTSKEAFRDLLETSVEAGLGLTTAFILEKLLSPDDFIGTYPQNKAERELIRSGNATTNSIRIGDHWVSLDYFGVLAAPLLVMLYAKRTHSAFKTTLAATSPILELPGIDEVKNFLSDIQSFADPETGVTFADFKNQSKKSAVNFLSSRAIPGFVTDLTKVVDTYQREADYGDISQTLSAKIPFLSKTLPIKENIFGDELKNENMASILLFGSRVKTAVATPEIKELERLSSGGNTVGITNVEKNSKRVKLMKESLSPQDYKEMIDGYRDELKEDIVKEISKKSYLKVSDEEKAIKLDKIEADLIDRWLKKYHYKRIYNKSKKK